MSTATTPKAVTCSWGYHNDFSQHAAGGLAAALGLLEASPGIKVGVFDQAPEFRLCGAGLALSPNGLSALKAISPAAYQELEDTSRKSGANRPGLQIDDEGGPHQL